MKKKLTLLLAFCGWIAMGSNAQIIQASIPDIGVWSSVDNTGIAIAPFYHWNAIAYDDPSSGDYYVQWREAATGNMLDLENQPGYNPDVAYYANADAVVVTYENGGDIWVDDYYLLSVTPTDYNINANHNIAPGQNPNIDMNSLGDGVLVWQDGSDIFACSFTIGSFTPGPVVWIGNGNTPDIALLDDNSHVVITYTQGAQLVVNTYDFGALQAGVAAMTTTDTYTPSGLGFQHPRVQANRNSNYGPSDLYTVVAQDDLGGFRWLIHGIFYTGLGNPNHVKVNLHAYNCGSPDPRPVVAYERSQVHIAWAQEYSFSCSGINPVDNGQDVLLGEFDFMGNNINGLTVFREVNRVNGDFSNSATSINTEYDGNYNINNSNWCEGLAYDLPGGLLWKKRDQPLPFFRSAGSDEYAIEIDKGVTSNLIKVEVTTMNEAFTEEDVVMEFALYDQSGRLIDMPEFRQEGMVFEIDATSLEHGIYLLHYTLNGETQAARIPHFTNQ